MRQGRDLVGSHKGVPVVGLAGTEEWSGAELTRDGLGWVGLCGGQVGRSTPDKVIYRGKDYTKMLDKRKNPFSE